MKQKNWALQISTLLVTTSCFAVMVSAFLFSMNLRNILTLWGEDIQMTVYLSPNLPAELQQTIEKNLKSADHVKDVQLVNQEKALSDFRVQLASYAPDLAKDDELLKLIPSSFQISLDSTLASTEQVRVLQLLAARAKSLEGVDDVSYGQAWIEKYSSFVTAIQWMTKAFALIIFAAAIFVMSNVIRSLVHSRREEIEILELIGATAAMIRRPFLLQGIGMGIISAMMALVCCFGIFKFLQSVFLQQLSFLRIGSQLQFLSFPMIFTFILVGGSLGAVGSYLCVRKLNDGWAASQAG